MVGVLARSSKNPNIRSLQLQSNGFRAVSFSLGKIKFTLIIRKINLVKAFGILKNFDHGKRNDAQEAGSRYYRGQSFQLDPRPSVRVSLYASVNRFLRSNLSLRRSDIKY